MAEILGDGLLVYWNTPLDVEAAGASPWDITGYMYIIYIYIIIYYYIYIMLYIQHIILIYSENNWMLII